MDRLVVLDVDGTITSPTVPLSPFTRAVLRGLVESGVGVALATGKQYPVIAPLAAELGLSAPQITAHGAVITDPVSGKILFDLRVPRACAETAIRTAEQVGFTIVLARDGLTFARQRTRDVEYMLSFGDPVPAIVPDLREALDPLPTHMMVIVYGDMAGYEAAEAALKAALGADLQITRSSPYYLDLLHKDVSKGAAVARLAGLLGVPREGIVAVGDGENDISMFRAAGVSVAMGNASQRVRAAASMVTAPCAEDGAAKALGKIFGLGLG